MFFGSSLFNFQKSKGYNLGFSFRSEKRFTNKDNIIFIQNSIEKRTYSEFKKGIKRKKNSMIKRRFILYKNGKFE